MISALLQAKAVVFFTNRSSATRFAPANGLRVKRKLYFCFALAVHIYHVQTQTTRHFYFRQVPATLCGGFLHLSVRVCHAIHVAICRRLGGQGAHGHCARQIHVVCECELGAHVAAAGRFAGLAHHFRKHGREPRTPFDEGGRRSPRAHHATHLPFGAAPHLCGLLLPEQHCHRRAEIAPQSARFDQNIATGRRNPRRGVLRHEEFQPLCREEKRRNGHALPHHYI